MRNLLLFRRAQPSARSPSSWAAARGRGLFPLTKDRSKPAVPFGGKYRLVDIPISNCLNSGLRSIYVLTQFNSMSLHRHIQASYKFDNFSRSFVDILAAQQTPEGSQWYQGTADAVRQNLRYFLEQPYDYFLILSGDQLYRMDFRTLLHQHIRSGAEITLADHAGAARRGFRFRHHAQRTRSPDHALRGKAEGPSGARRAEAEPRSCSNRSGSDPDEELFQASMGIYVFNRQVLVDCLKSDLVDFGKHVIPQAIGERHVNAYIFKGYWEDIGTIRAFYEANLDLTESCAAIQLLRSARRRSTRTRAFFPGAKSTARRCGRRSSRMVASFPTRTSSAV